MGKWDLILPKCVVKFLNLALKFCENETDARPSMAEVVRELKSILHMMTDSDNVLANPMDTDVEKVVTTPSSSSTVKDPYVSSEIASIELMEALYSKLYDKYTKLKLSRGSRSHTLCNCSIKTDNYVAFKVLLIFICAKIWIWVCLIYRARLQSKEVLCETQYWNCDAQVFLFTMQAQKEVPPDMQCKDKFLL
nr:putative lrr receptor-like serine/threonine-protein kinase [Quercus suber]